MFGNLHVKHVVAAVADLPPGSRKLIEVDGRRVVVFNIAGEFFGLHDRCPHQGGSLAGGTQCGHVASPTPGEFHFERAGEFIRCPWHGWKFDIKTGQSWCEPDKLKLKTYAVEVAAGTDLIEGPYKAETVPVVVEGRYVVVKA